MPRRYRPGVAGEMLLSPTEIEDAIVSEDMDRMLRDADQELLDEIGRDRR